MSSYHNIKVRYEVPVEKVFECNFGGTASLEDSAKLAKGLFEDSLDDPEEAEVDFGDPDMKAKKPKILGYTIREVVDGRYTGRTFELDQDGKPTSH